MNSVDGYGEASPFNVVDDVILPVVFVFQFLYESWFVVGLLEVVSAFACDDMLRIENVAGHDGSVGAIGW